MAEIQSNNGWTKTNLGNGWVKVVEVADTFGTNAADIVYSTVITNSTVAASGGDTIPIINELKAAGSFVLQITTGAGASLNADVYIEMKDTAGASSAILSPKLNIRRLSFILSVDCNAKPAEVLN